MPRWFRFEVFRQFLACLRRTCAMDGVTSRKPLQAHPCALLSGHLWPPKFSGGDTIHGTLSLVAPMEVAVDLL